MAVKAISNHVIFQFVDAIKRQQGLNRTQFEETTEWGFTVNSFDQSLNEHRVATVVAVGPKVAVDLKPGDEVLVEALRWTTGITHDGEEYWRTDEDNIIGIFG